MDTFVGYCSVELADEQSGVLFPMTVFFPTFTPGKTERLGPYSVDIAKDAEPKEGVFPLILISHGSGGSHLLYRTLAHHLARNGFIVGMPEHPFNNRSNNTLVNTVENLTNRPRHIRTAINWFYDSRKFARFVKPDSVAIIGHSMGGYTALALVGGVPISRPNESSDHQPHLISVIPDCRVRALVLLAPASVWFMAQGALSGVNIPILMLTGEKDEYTPSFHARIILEGVPDKTKIQHRVIKNAGHFSFLSPFPEFMTKVMFPPSQDPCGFDRESFHNKLNAEVLDFLLHNT
ncbi:chlorophyllase [Lucifera butyrica]|uniref:Chlorophyllase n=1 Tax=Lucifera butyrica TaxID=1351585 RepID=A0A498RG96_9FIRM|nr:alpha/beta fold hydrolase [Lucifera butyrica]VBB08128.1 chlorophyllase [Lucifera butyrica]